MKYAVLIGVLIVGIGVGYLIGANQGANEVEEKEPTTEFVQETIHDTIIHEETIRIPIAEEDYDSTKLIPDSLLALVDSLSSIIEDSLEDISIRTEKMIGQDWLNVNVIQEFEEQDSLLKSMLGISDKLPTRVLVEFWESPLNFSGYKLSRSKLILYGMPKGLDYKFYRKKGDYFLSAQTFYYSLRETEEFLPYLEVSKDVVFDD